ncbi:hypothetical protein BpHYR1_030990 [Brachionus plicatilis]|uniref:Uncharacterized protein n=1 Tax=Brachionus plicatilis TaxID=10195 RepID=A0A3M7T6A7_BRAPC|nr:hypothetical protein BpHYR1_030990 [Brachionus plicatilis]
MDNRQKQIVPRDNFILVQIINCAMSEIGSLIELLADNDYRVFEDIKQKNEILFNECLNSKSTLNLFSKNEDKYLTHFLKDGSSITFYTTMGTIYKADCLSVSEIENFDGYTQ